MRVLVLGTQDVDFVTNDNKVIKGKSVYGSFENRYVNGLKTNKFFIPDYIECINDIVPDAEIEIGFDMNGKIDSVSVY